jgi:succinyl-diaminopimelate desuccinylase
MLDPTDPIALTQALVRCPSVTPEEGGALALLGGILAQAGFDVHRPVFSEPGTPDVENLFARIGTDGPCLVFAGHTDVVPPGDEAGWTHAPFSGDLVDGLLYGRGTADMKGGVAACVSAALREIGNGIKGSIAFLVTGDEEGPAVNGTVKLLDWARARGERLDHCLLAEPTNPDALGDMIKIGRRGSLSGELTLLGRQGHVAYPDRADNPLHRLGPVLQALLHPLLDGGTSRFQPSNLEVTSVDTGNPSTNVVPASATVRFNVRFNDCWNGDTLRAELQRRIEAGLAACPRGPGAYAIRWREPVSDCFVTAPGALTQTLGEAVEAITGRVPELSTSGGTSDARFIKNHCAVVEFGLVGRTMHMADERVALSDLETLTRIYETFIARWFAAHA